MLLNDPTYVEASRKLAERMIREGGSSPVDRAAFRLPAGHRPAAQCRRVGRAEPSIREHSWQIPPLARAGGKLLAVGESKADAALDRAELAAWTMVASMMLNLDETVTKG